MTDPLFQMGDVLRVKDPEGFLSAFAKKIAGRDATLVGNVMDFGSSPTGLPKEFKGRIHVRFEKRNGRGKEFAEIMNQRDFILKEQSDAS